MHQDGTEGREALETAGREASVTVFEAREKLRGYA